ncbi:dihydrofolate reductase [bacterium endosymbiont of Pedicinus badii]|uniref:dihydrofolate reductase n=1 Tax=bacterium endosymbiont of Pedicinus badii TaxID=1719126 RepID=UPI0009BBAAD7|nr:dihydrofolate reductase [bacterium endosymbiont of Pedicinus badii]OQM34205.1 hypothetical protein AOQ89_02635 [bacterium endosymbiont of Pedicinus badii]
MKNFYFSIIVAVSKNGIIGNNNRIPWGYCKEDMIWFKKNTINKTVLMGRKTFQSMKSKILSNRRNIILSRTITKIKNAITISHPDKIKEFVQFSKEVVIIGGSEVYKIFLEKVKKIYLTSMDFSCFGDKTFPKLNKNNWTTIFRKNSKFLNKKVFFEILLKNI